MSAAQRRATRERIAEESRQERIRRAAPQLLEALERVTKAWLYEAGQGDGIMEEHADVLDAARAAIAAARGEP